MSSSLDAVFWLSLSTLVCGSVGLMIKTIYKIKCSEVKCCCGCLELKRDVDDEMKIDLERGEEIEKAKRSSISLGLK